MPMRIIMTAMAANKRFETFATACAPASPIERSMKNAHRNTAHTKARLTRKATPVVT